MKQKFEMDDFLLQAALVIGTLSFESFSVYYWMGLSFLILVGFKLADLTTSSELVWHNLFNFTLIKSNKILSDDEIGIVDHFYTTLNRCITTPMYIYHSAIYYRKYANVSMDFEISYLLNPYNLLIIFIHFICLFIIYDFVYYIFHRILHIPAIYPYIHKHHHRQVSPFRGTYDGINTHPFEYIFGLYLHLESIMFLSWITNNVHIIAIVLFYSFSGMMASLNHTRFAIYIPGFYDVRDHDVHHRWPRSNYGQFVMYWDKIFGSFLSFDDLNNKRKTKSK